ncbi:fibronectin type III domain-containing protein [Candidatus Dojkabacteria bacterium]|uniref:Fibronectin type III domain-containing protein n=1 Tax=Candidatus Dojkabacteria bacterium TaxID=2099670 RepID=A0A955RK93_9BACT|nr:fibronectin type III domain-containing protein [Candidatus Dojkabacteria bacterium]
MKHILKTNKLILLILLIIVTILSQTIYAEETNSTNYSIEGASFGGGGGQTDTTNGGNEYSIFGLIGELSDDRIESTNYRVLPGSPNVLVANVPEIECFETTSSGTTSCSDTDITPDGMVMLCGTSGCYDRARIEIDPQDNTTDTLYSIQIKESGSSTWRYVDGTTFIIEDEATHDINDYLTETTWEGTTSSFNILGLKPGTSYDAQITALHGDFTESMPSPVSTTTTGLPSLFFDIDIDTASGTTSETSAPYAIQLGVLNPVSVSTSNNLIWFDLGTNAISGISMFVEDDYSGLQSPTSLYTIPSLDSDLSSSLEGFGLVGNTTSETYIGPLTVESAFGNGGDIVGGISTTPVAIYNSNGGPLHNGRGSLFVKAKTSTSTPSGDDYQDEITFTITGTF